ncbi:hypothetical protein K431DRAFT_295576 [Polychaeton citri CBS 116435]|uniref:Azaphilone pigments biosynthesis cluster protein L N-terminal domain-containing protein n=1 Tax=Polychaeton citri CBS 116435 TaxID=1314669 RepID=A0A9P4Q5I2_9PEZI|nr:hypothetical protein K431DRAFT_295576 [Polychaeton citri CBS 116435]
MADLRINSDTPTLLEYSIQISQELYNNVASHEDHTDILPDLKQQLLLLLDALQMLDGVINGTSSTAFHTLNISLFNYSNACRKFCDKIQQATAELASSQTMQYRAEALQHQQEAPHGDPAATSSADNSAFTSMSIALKDCHSTVRSTVQGLCRRLTLIQHRSKTPASAATSSQIQFEQETVQLCLDILSKADSKIVHHRTLNFEHVSSEEDSKLAIVSTFGDLITAKWVNASRGSTHVEGQLSDSSLTHIFSTTPIRTTEDVTTDPDPRSVSQFHSRYGSGRILEPLKMQSTANIRQTSAP